MNKIGLVVVLMVNFAIDGKGFLPENSGRPSAKEMFYKRYCSREAYGRQLDKLSTVKERQLIAAWLQLVLLEAKDDLFKKLESTEEWKARTQQVDRMVKMLSFDTHAKLPLEVYAECYETICPEKRIIPGLDDTKLGELMHPNKLKRTMGYDY